MPAMVWVVFVLLILCMAIPYGKLYLWDRPVAVLSPTGPLSWTLYKVGYKPSDT